MLDDPEQHVVMPDGTKVEITPGPDADSVVGGITEVGTYALTRPDGSTAERDFLDLGDRGQVAADLAFETTYAARDAKPAGGPDPMTVAANLPINDPIGPNEDDAFPPGTVRDGNGTAIGPDGTLYKDEPGSFWHGAEIIHTYTRADMLRDGSLIDHSQMAREAGITWPVALTTAAQADAVTWNDSNAGLQDETGRAWDVVWMASHAIRARARQSNDITPGTTIPFEMVRVPNTPRAQQPRKATLHLVFAPDIDGQPAWTIKMPDES